MRFLVTLVLLFSVTPGMSEVAEAAVHLVVHGDLPHHDELAHDQDCSEHSCTPLAHHCGCHTTMSAQTTVHVDGSATPSMSHASCPAAATEVGRVTGPPPLRPPIR